MSNSHVVVSSRDSVVGQTTVQVSLNLRHWLYFSAMLCLISLLALFYLTQTSHIARQIEEMESLEYDLHVLKQKNNELLLQIAQFEQAARIKQQAQLLGLRPPEQVEYLEVVLDEVVAPLDSEAYAPTSDPNATSLSLDQSSRLVQQGWWQKLVRQFADWISGGAPTRHERHATSFR